MKTERMELRLDAELRAKLEALAGLSGKPASLVVRRLIARAYQDAFPLEGATAQAPVRTPAKSASAVEAESDDLCDLTTEEVFAMAGIPMGPDYPTPKGDDESTSAPVTTTSTEAGP